MSKIPEVIWLPNEGERKLYFDNALVERLLTEYHFTNCTSVKLRDLVMEHCTLLINNVILTNRLHKLSYGQDIDELTIVAWMQIERTLYKYKSIIYCGQCYPKLNHIKREKVRIHEPTETSVGIPSPKDVAERGLQCPLHKAAPTTIIYKGVSKVFNMWSSITRTVCLAHIKREDRDKRNAHNDLVRNDIDRKSHSNSSLANNSKLQQFFIDARELFRHDQHMLIIIDAMQRLSESDDHAGAGLIGKLSRDTKLSRAAVKKCMGFMRLRMDELNK